MRKYYGSKEARTGARNFARKFYSSKAWEKKSKAYRKEHPLCERCLKRGLFTPSTCVHHKEHITKDNYHDPRVLFNDENLEALCDLCHAKEHSEGSFFEFSEDGTLIDFKREE